ncbi:MAG: DPP IV N-terminal domain-containing protein [Crocinitomicaceae bacterium]|nr:DPP IV N-terminal domain-containing protein [Crocinitomicaceae bacterium]MDP4740371.1 DPP IV N-terminal domain-containing protein [Crocinitomicaceae bacterium]MDP4800291.1 DPP IV N-terminal domain-containing protein [Crocinitomicaceae bacterium]MDP4806626.1 DPP IV N-terminal domain-containing protein [Crocinitomicaceae bacterium]MDP4868227.1 DPP IV N-terminal domain-containing protein [Crocinitomicaceae bacterium]
MKHFFQFLFIGLAFVSFGQKKSFDLKESVLKQRALSPVRLNNFQWIPDTDQYTVCSADWKSMEVSSVSSEKSSELVSLAQINEKLGTSFPHLAFATWISKDVLEVSDGGSVYALYNVATKTGSVQKVQDGGENVHFHAASKRLAYTIDNNLYVDGRAVTKNKDKNIVSGQTYARSEFGISEGIFWSNSGALLAFYQKDESAVHDYPLLDINQTPGAVRFIKYPMAGQASEKPKVGIYNLKSKKTVFISPRSGADAYLTNVSFTPSEKYLLVAEVNRDQNHMWLYLYDLKGNLVRTLWEEQNDKWVEPEHPAFFPSNTSDNFIWISEKNGFNNLYYVDINGQIMKTVTANKFVIKDILEANEDGSKIYFSATGANPCNTLVYEVDLQGNQRLLTNAEGTHRFALAPKGAYYYDGYSSVEVANKEYVMTLNGKMAKLLQDSPDKLAEYNIGSTEIGNIKGKDGSALYYRMIKPADFDPTKKYPVLVYVYGGPHAQMVTNSWLAGANLWMHWLANQGYIVFTLDNRGSGERGFAFESQIHRQLGTVEMEDQLTGVDFLKSLPYIDGQRMAVHGWSFGGFMTTSLMLRQAGVFNVGVAGGPVTDWKFYEIMYGERYMDRPEQNPEGYQANSLLNHTKNLKGKLLLIHGTVDDVVVMQHNEALLKSFIENGVQADYFVYPMHPHNVSGKDRAHLMEKVLLYILEYNK